MEKQASIFVAGGRTLIGGAIHQALRREGYTGIVAMPEAEPDLRCASSVANFFARTRPRYVFLMAGMSGGIGANRTYPASLMLDNLMVQSHVIDCAYRFGTTRLFYLASSCSYPRDCPQPMREESLFTGPLEPTNEAYAVAKLAGLTLCKAYCDQYGADFISGIPANVFGPGDDFSPENSHVVGALLARMHAAKLRTEESVSIWGTGNALREFVYVDDIAAACLFLMNTAQERIGIGPINIGGGETVSIRELAETIQAVVGYRGELIYCTDKPDGMPIKQLDATRIQALGWQPKTSLRAGLEATYCAYRKSA